MPIKSIKINNIALPVNRSFTTNQLNEKYPETAGRESPLGILGIYDPDLRKIFIAKDQGKERKDQVLLHECIEAINDQAELGLEDNHAKIVALENAMLYFLLNNRKFIEQLWESQGGKK